MKEFTGPEISRRRFFAFAGAGGLLLARRPLIGDEPGIVPTMINGAAKAKIVQRPLRRNITVLEGSGGNIAVLSGRDGKLLVDSGFSVSRRAVSGALTSISPDPVRHLINTHWHFDHTDGNSWLHEVGSAITAHENTRKRLSVSTRVDCLRRENNRVPPRYLCHVWWHYSRYPVAARAALLFPHPLLGRLWPASVRIRLL